jgi:hypothetical protein
VDEASKKKHIGIEIGKVAAEKSRGLFSADDWQCTKCGNVNWARRQQCNMCNAPKFGEVEERTGYGGGYNDRGVVEYVARDESDDEYDEFGRKKKRFRQSSNSEESKGDADEMGEGESIVSSDLPKAKDSGDEEEEEDDGEDDDDGDLSKYDLSDWEGGKDDKGSEESEPGASKRIKIDSPTSTQSFDGSSTLGDEFPGPSNSQKALANTVSQTRNHLK